MSSVTKLMILCVSVCMYVAQYHEDKTPHEYEPEFFVAAGDQDEHRFVRSPLRVKVGKLSTAFHELDLRFCGLDNLMDSDVTPVVRMEGAAAQVTSVEHDDAKTSSNAVDIKAKIIEIL